MCQFWCSSSVCPRQNYVYTMAMLRRIFMYFSHPWLTTHVISVFVTVVPRGEKCSLVAWQAPRREWSSNWCACAKLMYVPSSLIVEKCSYGLDCCISFVGAHLYRVHKGRPIIACNTAGGECYWWAYTVAHSQEYSLDCTEPISDGSNGKNMWRIHM
jgi:hypothetical protein